MALNTDELAQRLASLSERFAHLAQSLSQSAQLTQSGAPPAESLIDEITSIRAEFVDVRQRVVEAAKALSVNAPGMAEIDSLKALKTVVDAVAKGIADQEKRAALLEAQTKVMTVLNRVLAISHVDGPNFTALVQCQTKAREIRQAAQDPKAFDSENAPAFLESTPSFAALLTMIENRDALDDDKFAALEDAVTQSFGKTLAVAATRGKLVVGAVAAPAAAAGRPAAAAPRGLEPSPRMATPAPAAPQPAARVAAAPVAAAPLAATAPDAAAAPAEPAAPAPLILGGPSGGSPAARAGSSSGAEQGEAQSGEQSGQDEAAQWWVSAWARWTSWKGTLSFADAVKEELAKYNYVLSVPIQKSTDYEEGLLAYGYSILIDHIEHLHAGFVNKALNSLKTFQPGQPGQARTVGGHLYNVLVNEGKLGEHYPEFVKAVMLAAVPEPGLWTHARILESTTETRIFTHPSNRIGDPEHNSQRLTQERQRFADHRFPIVVAPLTTRFFAIAADLREPRAIDVKLLDGRNDSDQAWLMTMPPVGRTELKAEVLRLFPEGTSVPGLGRDYATLWIAVFNADPQTEKKYDLTLSLKQSSKQSAGTFRSARTA
jgi:hypothetical protein